MAILVGKDYDYIWLSSGIGILMFDLLVLQLESNLQAVGKGRIFEGLLVRFILPWRQNENQHLLSKVYVLRILIL